MNLRLRVKKLQASASGFTLIELLIVIGILGILLAITLVALNPTQHFQGARNAQRSSDVTAILDAIYEYEAANKGNLPPSIASVSNTPVELTSNLTSFPTGVEVCSDLVPAYLADMPIDPLTGSKTPTTGAACTATNYDTGYTIKISPSNRITVSAPGAEGGASIKVTR